MDIDGFGLRYGVFYGHSCLGLFQNDLTAKKFLECENKFFGGGCFIRQIKDIHFNLANFISHDCHIYFEV